MGCIDMEEHPKKVLTYKTYNKIGHLSKSRLGEGDHFVDAKTEKTATKELDDLLTLIIVQEKLDGSNVCVANVGGEIVAMGRSGYRCSESNQEQHRRFANWVQLKINHFQNLLMPGDRIVGEWLAQAHGTRYELEHDPFVAFDLFKGEDRCTYHDFLLNVLPWGFITPQVYHIGGSCSISRIEKLSSKIKSIHNAIDPIEGFIWRIETNGKFKNIVKYVRAQKEDGKYFKDGQEVWNCDNNFYFYPLSQYPVEAQCS